MTHATGNTAHTAVPITADTSGLSTSAKEMLGLLIEAAKIIDIVYLKQAGQSAPHEGWQFDPSLPNQLYPAGTTKASLQEYFDKHSEEESVLRHPTAVVIKEGENLKAVPYAEQYREELSRAAALLLRASELAEDEKLARFLKSRSEAFLTNAYRESDILWIHTNGPVEITIGPFEDYADTLLGVKRMFEAVVGVVLEEDTAMANRFSESIRKFDRMLGERYGYTARTTLTPMVVIDEIFAAGESLYDYVPMAYNLPNDADIHEEVGSKKVFIKNVMRAKFDAITRLIAGRVLCGKDFSRFDPDIYLQHVIGHEASHGLSFRFEGEDFGPIASGLEEGKADVFGMWFLFYLVDQGMFQSSVAETAAMQNVTDGLRQVRFGEAEAHARGALLQFNWFIAAGALTVSEKGLRYDTALLRQAVESLGDELYQLSLTKDDDAAESFLAKWGY
ncbi:MAG TPA: hypothetical protein VGE31_00750, partial [Candidatus Paceibacterota bacterium]